MSKNEYCCDCDMVHSDMVEHVRGEMLKDAQFCLISNILKRLRTQSESESFGHFLTMRCACVTLRTCFR